VTILLIICGAAMTLAGLGFLLRSTQTNPVEKRVTRSLKRTLQDGIPTSVPVMPKGYSPEDLMPGRGGKGHNVSSPAWA
jgi:hypothetical protein